MGAGHGSIGTVVWGVMMRATTSTALALLLATMGTVALAAPPPPSDPAPAFSLPASDGTRRAPSDLTGKKTLVLVFFRGVW